MANSNLAARASTGKLLTFLHQDDLWLPSRLAELRSTIRAHPDRSLWIAPTRFIDDDGRFVGSWRLPFASSVTCVEAPHLLEHLLVQNFIAMPAPVFTRRAFDSVAGMDKDLWFTADWDLWLKLGAATGAGLSPTATTAFRLHSQSQTVRRADAHQAMRSQIETVRSRHIPRLATSASRAAVDRAGRFSCELNVALAALASRQPVAWSRLLRAFADWVQVAAIDSFATPDS